MMEEILRIIRNSARGYGGGAQSVLSAQASSEQTDWEPLERELVGQGISIDYVQGHRDDITVLLSEVVLDEGLTNEDIWPDDSASQIPGQPCQSEITTRERRNQESSILDHAATSEQRSLSISARDDILAGATKEEIKQATVRLKNWGLDLEKIGARDNSSKRRPFKKLFSSTDTYTGAHSLCHAAWQGHELALRLIIQKGVDVNGLDTNMSAIAWAIDGKADDMQTVSIIKLILQSGGDLSRATRKDKDIYPVICKAVQRKKISVVEFLLDEGVDVNQTGSKYDPSALPLAIRDLNRPLVELLLDRGAEVNCSYYTTVVARFISITPLQELGLVSRKLEKDPPELQEIRRLLESAGAKL